MDDTKEKIVISKEEEYLIRKFIWLNHGCSIVCLYGDDGEMQCGNLSIHPSLDFKIMPMKKIIETLIKAWRMNAEKEIAMGTIPAFQKDEGKV